MILNNCFEFPTRNRTPESLFVKKKSFIEAKISIVKYIRGGLRLFLVYLFLKG